LGAQSAVAGGGRYDGLVEEVGGPVTPGIGFAMGLERVLLALEKQNLLPPSGDDIDVFAVANSDVNFPLLFKTVLALRRQGLKVEYDFAIGSMKSQMKKANKFNAKKVLIFGDEELGRGCVTLRDMATSEQKEIAVEKINSEIGECLR